MKPSKVTLKYQYEIVKKRNMVLMPASAASFIILGIVFCVIFSEVFWVGLIVIATGLGTLLLFWALNRYLTKKIREIEEDERKEETIQNK